MQFHTIKRVHPNKKDRIIGRGGKHAKTSGRGTKGQNARSGHKKRPEIRDFIKRIPKLRGRGKNINTSIQDKPRVVNLSELNKLFKAGDSVSPKVLIEKGVINKVSGILPKVKILGGGELDKKLSISGCLVSASAKSSIERAGGTVII
jgi:large subunit ribosomal protein L15